jgi:hypothetical protein
MKTSTPDPAEPEPNRIILFDAETHRFRGGKNRRIKSKPGGAAGAENREKTEGRRKLEAITSLPPLPLRSQVLTCLVLLCVSATPRRIDGFVSRVGFA